MGRVEGPADALFGFSRQLGLYCRLCLAVWRASQEMAKKYQLALIALADLTHAKMDMHPYPRVPRQPMVHGVGEQSSHLLTGRGERWKPTHGNAPSPV